MREDEILAQLEVTLEGYSAGYSNTEAIKAFDELLKELEQTSDAPTNLVTEETNSVRGWVGILYSPRKHQKHGGAETVSLYIRQDLVSLRTMILCSR